MENWTIENFLTVGHAFVKMAGFFWPLIILAIVFMIVEWRKESVQ